MTFHEIMNFHTGNEAVYREIKKNLGQILPFVGAGLTARFYGSWSSAVNSLGENLSSEADRKTLSKMLNRFDYLGAAQILEDKRGENNLRRDMVHYFTRDKLMNRWRELREEAVFLLPPLFPCPVLTTNFDEGIEIVYNHWNSGDFRVLSPNSKSLRQQATDLRNTPCLFKLHGSVFGDMADKAAIVFTKRQYRRHYGPYSWLFGGAKGALKDFVDRRSLLFLGCSLEQDKTVDVIRRQAGPGKTHFAIVNAVPGAQDQRIQIGRAHV